MDDWFYISDIVAAVGKFVQAAGCIIVALYTFTKRNGRASIRIGRWVSCQLARI